MDPEEYILHSHPGSPGSYGSSPDRRHQTSWTGQLRIPQPPRYSWMGFNTSLSGATAGSGASSPPSPSHRRSGNPPFHLGHPASPLPPPDPAFPGVPQQDPFAPPLFWNSSLQQTSGPHTLTLPDVVLPPSHTNSSLPSPSSRNQRGVTFQLPPAAAAPSFPPGPSHFPFSSATSNNSSAPPPNHLSRYSTAIPRPPIISRSEYATHSAASHAPHSSSNSPTSEQRRRATLHRHRRITRVFAMADALEESDESTPRRPPMEPRASLNHRGAVSSARIGSDAYMRQLQTLRGSLPWKRVASKMLVESLETVRIEDLASQEKSCVICYNDFGAPTPEGNIESPVRLPKCKHVFGDHCLKKWLEESDSCPYCRDKLPSEPKIHGSMTRQFLEYMRDGGVSSTARIPDDLMIRVLASETDPAVPFPIPTPVSIPVSVPVSAPISGRHSPPSDSDEPVRRTRQRRSSSSTSRDSAEGRSVRFAPANRSESPNQIASQFTTASPPPSGLPPGQATGFSNLESSSIRELTGAPSADDEPGQSTSIGARVASRQRRIELLQHVIRHGQRLVRHRVVRTDRELAALRSDVLGLSGEAVASGSSILHPDTDTLASGSSILHPDRDAVSSRTRSSLAMEQTRAG